jgi:hypothetical protein
MQARISMISIGVKDLRTAIEFNQQGVRITMKEVRLVKIVSDQASTYNQLLI